MNLTRLFAIVKKEFIHIMRDKASLGIAIMMPVVFILVFGYAVNTDVDHINMAVFDQNHSIESRAFIDKFSNSNYFNVTYYVNDIKSMESLIDGGRAKAALIIPPDFAKQLKRNESPGVQLIIDGTDPTIAKTALQSGVLVGKNFLLKENSSVSIQRGVDLRTRVWYNPNLESNKFTIPGLIGLIMQNITVLLTAFALVREKEKGTIELLIVTPIKPIELIIGKMIPYIFTGFIGFLLALFLGTTWFHVPIQGNLMLLIVLGTGFVICSLAIGMLISTIAKTQLQAMQMAFLFILPSVLLSGFVFPREGMPQIIKWVGYGIPLTYFLEILRKIILKGVGMTYLYKDVIILAAFGTILLTLACLRFNKKLD